MNLSKTGNLISQLRKEKGLTQKQLAYKLNICAKTVSKWETGHGFPDMSLISKLSDIFQVDISKLIDGEIPHKKPEAQNMKKTRFYVCEKCGNLLTSTNNSEIICCGRKLTPLKVKEADNSHSLSIEKIEDDYYITFSHPMTKDHYISFFSYVRFNRVLTVKLYPEQNGELRFPQMRGGRMHYYCNNHGLFQVKI